NVQAIRTQVWGKDAKLFYELEDAYYDYRLSLTEPDNRFNQTHNADDFIEQYNQLLEEHSADLDSFSLNSDIAKYEAALQLIPENMTEEQSANIKAQLADKYLTSNEQKSITSRVEQVNQQTQEITNYQQGLSQLEITLTHERATSKKTMNEQDWQIYKTERFYQFRLKFFNS
ncbi:MAG: chromosome segregation ATPase, partial [Colwellia sp.]|nr:chromosome segregation ATPase [Colwellia sp.]